jgi:hypothetical protein
MTKNIGLTAIVLAGALASGLLGACDKQEDGACIMIYDNRDDCRIRTTADMCTKFASGGVGAPKSTRFEPVTQEDRDRYENIKAPGSDITPLICQRLHYLHCQQASGLCTKN